MAEMASLSTGVDIEEVNRPRQDKATMNPDAMLKSLNESIPNFEREHVDHIHSSQREAKTHFEQYKILVSLNEPSGDGHYYTFVYQRSNIVHGLTPTEIQIFDKQGDHLKIKPKDGVTKSIFHRAFEKVDQLFNQEPEEEASEEKTGKK